ncbi:hypothetical protein RirG_241700 [Rhizophagus irregularis DAOM 197198w]|nr:hypothetical protein RirG_241700 [Rhizophagus irregularis DAOM 197198w]
MPLQNFLWMQLQNLSKKYLIENHSKYLRKYPIQFDFTLIISTKLPNPLLEIILKRDDLNLVEIEIWENLIKWGVAQIPKQLSNDPNDWIKEDFTELERKIYNLIPLIRFYQISSKELFKKIKPFEEILPKEIKQDILQFHMVP